MKMKTSAKIMVMGLTATVLMSAGVVTSIQAAGPAMQGQITLHPLSPQDIKDFGLTGIQGASGLNTVGIGEPVYLEALVNAAIAPSNILSVTWTLIGKPVGSAIALGPLPASPLGTNVPTYKIADRINQSGSPVYQVAGRALLRPDVTGIMSEQYTVVATINTSGSGTTNLIQKITAGRYLGISACSLCHNGSPGIPNKVAPWSQTLHATFFTKAIDGLKSDHYSKNCIVCHGVGNDTNALAVNGGFDDVAAQVGWTFPTVLTNGNWAAVPASLKNLANIQCENCHGPGSQHAFFLGNTNLIAVSYVAGNCAQCHDSEPQHVKVAEWSNSLHARVTRTPSGPGREACVRCHTAPGFRNFIENAETGTAYVTNTTYEAITCAACHDPHDASNPHQLRAANSITLPEGTTVTNVGLGALCMECHHSRNGEANQNIANYKLGLPTWAGGSSFGVHDSTAGDMVEGVNAITYGKVIPSGSHSAVISNVCVGCHMQPVATTHPAFGQAGGHTYSMTYKVVNGGVTNTQDLVDVCIKCHGPITEFDFARKDYNGDGIIEGVQTEVQHLLDKLSTLLPNSTYQSNPDNYVADGLVKVIDARATVKTNWPTKFLQGAWNYGFVSVEGSHGVHNAPYAVGVLKASIANLTGDSNNDGLLDAWQIQYFGPGFATNSLAGLKGVNNANGVPNWLMFALGLSPYSAFTVAGSGVLFVNDGNIENGATNTIAIYTAAEIAFNTVPGTTYQIQGITELTGSWQNIGTNIVGTGNTVSYLTPTRDNTQMFFRVVHTP